MLIYTEILIIILIFTIATVVEKITFEINPFIWIVGGIIGFVYNFFNIGFCSILESVIAFIVTFIFVFIILCVNTGEMIGGGIVKGLIMCSIFFGKMVVITFLFFLILYYLGYKIIHRKGKEYLPGENLKSGMPILNLSVLMTIVCNMAFLIYLK